MPTFSFFAGELAFLFATSLFIINIIFLLSHSLLQEFDFFSSKSAVA